MDQVIPLAHASIFSVFTYTWVTPLMVSFFNPVAVVIWTHSYTRTWVINERCKPPIYGLLMNHVQLRPCLPGLMKPGSEGHARPTNGIKH